MALQLADTLIVLLLLATLNLNHAIARTPATT